VQTNNKGDNVAKKTLYKAEWFWEDYVGKKWEELHWGNTGDNHPTICHPQGRNSKSAYKPKSLFWHYQMTGIDKSKYKLDEVSFILVIGKFNTNSNPLPSIKVFSGDNNAPYRKTPLFTTSTYTRLSNHFDFDYYTLKYKIKGVTIDDLKNIIVEVDWGRTKVTGSSTIYVNRARLVVDYSLQDPKWALYSSISPSSATTNDKVAWKLVVKNTGYCSSSNSVSLSLPKGVTIVSSSGGGAYNNNTKTWTLGQVCKGGSVTRTFYLKSSSVGLKNLVATNSSNLVVNKSVTQSVTFIQYIPPPQPKDVVTYTFYDEAKFEKEPYQYFDINIQGYGNNHIGEEYVCYNLATSENVEMYLPLRSTAELVDDNNNIVELVTDSSIADSDNKLCLHIERIGDDFVANIRVYVYLLDDATGTVTTTQGDNSWSQEFDILPKRGVKLFTDDLISRDTTYVTNSINIGVPNIWTIRANVSRNNFFDEKKENMEIVIEDKIAYIGVIPLSRCHKADVTADSKNSLIENRYLNRAYYGKKGDYSEDIKMTLRIAWYDVATLQGLCEMDKPIPIDTIPNRADGDPLNHRGWAEIYEVNNIKKINDMLYECDVGVKYLSHDINTRFTITEAKKLTEATIKYYLALVHDYNMDLLDIFKLNYYEFWTTLEDANGDKIGSYDIDPNATLIMNRDLNKHSTYDIVFRNTVPVLRSEDYDNNFEMALKVINKDNGNVLFEHDYNNFKHYDFTNQYAENTTDATSKYLNGANYETLNFERIGLGYDELSPLIEDMKVATHFNTKETVHITDPTEQFEIFLLDAYNKGIENATVNVRITGSDNFTTTFNCITDLYGRIFFNVDWGNGDYTVTLNFFENEKYRACTYSVGLEVELEYVQYHFTYPSNQQFIGSNSNFVCTLLDENENPVSNNILHYSFKDIGSDEYEHEETVTTDVDGKATIPIKRMNGSQMIRVNFKGFSENGTVYQPVQFEEQINVTNLNLSELIVEADNLEMVQGDSEKQYSVIVKNKETGSVVQDLDMDFYLYNNDESYHLNATTNSYGVASVPIYLKGGAWKVDVYFKGDETYNPYIITRNVLISNFIRYDSFINGDNATLNENKLLDGSQDYYSLKFTDENGNDIVDEPVNIKIYDATLTHSTESNPYIDVILSSDLNGEITIPFISHNEDVIVKSTYMGSIKYNPCESVNMISFENIATKTTQTLSKVTEQVINIETGLTEDEDHIKLYKGGILQNEWESDFTVVNSITNNRITSYHTDINKLFDDEKLLDHNKLPKGTYNVTIFKKGDNSNYSICRTFTITTVNDGRVSLGKWQSFQDVLVGELTHTVLNGDNKYVGDFAHIRFMLNFWIPNNIKVYVVSGDDNFHYETITHEMVNEDGKKITYFDVYMILQDWDSYYFDFEDSVILEDFGMGDLLKYDSTQKNDVSISQTGFAYNNETHQNIAITVERVSEPNAVIKYVNNYICIRATNLETNEELYYYTFITDNLKPFDFSFDLTTTSGDEPNWKLEIFLNNTDEDKGGYYITTGLITTSTVINTDTILPIFADGESYIEKGLDMTFANDGFYFIIGDIVGGK